jgi:BirA family biotin operon repressor/biotin-[acetyl-CoA-carboxylase] ligase
MEWSSNVVATDIDTQSKKRSSEAVDIEWFEELDSTNSYCRRMVEKGEAFPPWIVAARQQTAGRGRGANSWWSPEGCLMFSALLDSTQYASSAASVPQAALAIGVALAEELSKWVPSEEVQLKWPNDVYLRGRKVAGILVEGTAPTALQTGDKIHGLWWIVGVGLNLAIDWERAPVEVRDRATCLASESGVTFSLEDFLPRLWSTMDRVLTEWGTNPEKILELFRSRCHLTGKLIEVEQGRERHRGICQGIDKSGQLILATEVGHRAISSGSIRQLEG